MTSMDSKGSQRDESPPKGTVRRSTVRNTTRRSSGVVGQNVRAVVRNKLAERKGNNLSASQHKAPASVSGNNHSTNGSRSVSSINMSPRHQRNTLGSRASSGNNSSSNHGGDSASNREVDSPSKKGSRPGSVSQFLKSTHRQLKAEIAKIQDKIIFLCVLRVCSTSWPFVVWLNQYYSR